MLQSQREFMMSPLMTTMNTMKTMNNMKKSKIKRKGQTSSANFHVVGGKMRQKYLF